jgi:glycosyltransferase involved in cell wall biosynthesis
MPEFSLVVATKDRTSELARFISSIDDQGAADYELIIVDQNGDDRLVPIIALSLNQERILHLRCSPGVSRARNVGMEHARGKIIAFPDDDCWYPPGLMKEVSGWFDTNKSYEILSIMARDTDGVSSCNHWFQDSCDITLLNVFRTSGGSGYFIRADGVARTVRYDTGIGPGSGTPYLCGEDCDFILAAMEKGARGRFEAKWHLGHPRKDVRNGSVSSDRVYGFGQGMGFVQRKHHLAWLWVAFNAYDYGRALCFSVLGRIVQAKLWYWHGRGLIKGFLVPDSNYASGKSQT